MPGKIQINRFGGIMPRTHPTLLPAEGAQRAHNLTLKEGKVAPLREPLMLSGVPVEMENGLARIGEAGTIWMWHHGESKTMLAWPGDVRIAEGNLSQDERSRLFVTGETGIGENHPCMYAMDGLEITRHDLVKERMDPPVIETAAPSDPVNERYTIFYQTWVDRWGYESPPSRPTDEVAYNDGQVVNVGIAPAPVLAVKRRIWKVISGTQTEAVQFVAEQELLEGAGFFTAFNFSTSDENAGEILRGKDGVPGDLVWMTRVPGDFYAGFCRENKREVRFSEVGFPSFWPGEYGYGVGADIVGLGVTLNSVFVLTRGMPHVLTGTGPDTMNIAVLASAQGCVSARSICVMEGSVCYASGDGICMVGDGSPNVNIVTDGIFTRAQWQKLNPEGCRVAGHNGSLFLWFEGGREGYVVSLKDNSVAAVTTHDEVARACCVDVAGDRLYFVREG